MTTYIFIGRHFAVLLEINIYKMFVALVGGLLYGTIFRTALINTRRGNMAQFTEHQLFRTLLLLLCSIK